MKVSILYRPNSEHASKVEDFANELKKVYSKGAELVDVDSPAGSDLAKVYDILSYPTIIATRDDGQLVQVWQGELLPLASEVAYYISS